MDKKAPAKKQIIKMQTFLYNGLDDKGKRVSGEITAKTVASAKEMLQTQNITVLTIKKKGFSLMSRGDPKVSSSDITLFTRQMSTMLLAGIPLAQGLSIIGEGAGNRPLGILTKRLKQELEGGNSFSSVLKKHPEYFDNLFCSLVESGEQSGTLDTMLDRIAQYKEKTDSLKRKLKKALYYPCAIVTIALGVSCLLLLKVVPTFKDLFKGFGADLPAFTQFVLNISDGLQNHGPTVFIVLVVSIVAIYKAHKKFVPFQHFVQRLTLKIPVFGSIIKKSIVARFARTLSTTSSSGVPLTDALESIADSCGNIVYSNAIYKISEGVSAGQQIRVVLKKTGVFPILVVQMIGIGEESGALDTMLTKVANIYEEEVNAAVDGLTSLLEPMIMAFLGVVVGGLVVAMYLPIFKLGSVV